jgi:hypothetical protein
MSAGGFLLIARPAEPAYRHPANGKNSTAVDRSRPLKNLDFLLIGALDANNGRFAPSITFQSIEIE